MVVWALNNFGILDFINDIAAGWTWTWKFLIFITAGHIATGHVFWRTVITLVSPSKSGLTEMGILQKFWIVFAFLSENGALEHFAFKLFVIGSDYDGTCTKRLRHVGPYRRPLIMITVNFLILSLWIMLQSDTYSKKIYLTLVSPSNPDLTETWILQKLSICYIFLAKIGHCSIFRIIITYIICKVIQINIESNQLSKFLNKK